MSSGDLSKIILSLGKPIPHSSSSKSHLEVFVEHLEEDKGHSSSEKDIPSSHVPSIARVESEKPMGVECIDLNASLIQHFCSNLQLVIEGEEGEVNSFSNDSGELLSADEEEDLDILLLCSIVQKLIGLLIILNGC